jgi:hypothetical protein
LKVVNDLALRSSRSNGGDSRSQSSTKKPVRTGVLEQRDPSHLVERQGTLQRCLCPGDGAGGRVRTASRNGPNGWQR